MVSITLFHICELAILRSCFDSYSRTKYFFLEMSTHFLFTVAVKETCHDLLFLDLYNSNLKPVFTQRYGLLPAPLDAHFCFYYLPIFILSPNLMPIFKAVLYRVPTRILAKYQACQVINQLKISSIILCLND